MRRSLSSFPTLYQWGYPDVFDVRQEIPYKFELCVHRTQNSKQKRERVRDQERENTVAFHCALLVVLPPLLLYIPVNYLLSEIIIRHHVDEHIEDDTLCMPEVNPTVMERLVVRHVADDFINDDDEQLSPQSGSSDGIMTSFSSGFHEADMFLELDDAFNNAGGSSSEQSRINKGARAKQPYNHNSGSKLIKCWNSSPITPQKVLNHYLGVRYARLFWVGDRVTQKILIGTPSPSLKRVLLPVLPLHMSKRCTLKRIKPFPRHHGEGIGDNFSSVVLGEMYTRRTKETSRAHHCRRPPSVNIDNVGNKAFPTLSHLHVRNCSPDAVRPTVILTAHLTSEEVVPTLWVQRPTLCGVGSSPNPLVGHPDTLPLLLIIVFVLFLYYNYLDRCM
ncbi:NBS-LRR type resistance protein [Cucumis melo var. makuwa]|uniref:NBS-LRR type resistance protein n=1 Tax=Cucumis melo var. makuwa TaxID=1194695 RepID=A0A5D3CQZ8_CUCMM|nr:NBS-LRR type resistance protein [Cucumis melo var. makuwa]